MVMSISTKAGAVYLAGMITGVLITAWFCLGERPGAAASETAGFSDVPGTHWAAASVTALKGKKIVLGTSPTTYSGDRYVTRYEAAALLDRFVHYIEQSKQPLHTGSLDQSKMPTISNSWARPAMIDLAQNKFIAVNSPLLSPPGAADVTANQMSDALAQVSTRLADRATPATQDAGPED